ncbi:hypothetical protein [Kocuria sp. KH4]
MIRHRHRLSTVLVVCALPLAGCGAGAEQTSQQATTSPTSAAASTSTPTVQATPAVPGDGTFPVPGDADRSDVESTAHTAALMLHSWDTATDRTETAAAIRAKPLMSEEWAANQIEPQRNSSQGAWLKPSEHRAYSEARAVTAIGDAARDVAPDKAIRVYDVTWSWISRDEEPAPGTGRRQVTLYLEKHDGAWEVVGHQLRDMDAGGAGEQ